MPFSWRSQSPRSPRRVCGALVGASSKRRSHSQARGSARKAHAMISTRAVAEDARSDRKVPTAAHTLWECADLVLVPLAAFAVYWVSALRLEAAQATVHFGSDAPMYAW